MQNPTHVAALTDAELDQLEQFIFSDAVSEDSLDLIGIHGFLCALNIGPDDIDEKEWLEVLFDGMPNWESADQAAQITQLLQRWKGTIHSDLYSDNELEMLCDLTLIPEEGEEEADLEVWAQAFMEGVFLREEQWFAEGSAKEEIIAELMLPIMVISGLFDDKEFRQMRNDKRISEQMAEQIPELLVDLYLQFHAPE